jgi:hypothetical protein
MFSLVWVRLSLKLLTPLREGLKGAVKGAGGGLHIAQVFGKFGDATPTTNPKAVKPKTIKTALINLANSLAAYAIIQEPGFTKENMVVKISNMNPKRLDVQAAQPLSTIRLIRERGLTD